MRNGIAYGGSSSKLSSFTYDNSGTDLTANTVQSAIDELVELLLAIENKRKNKGGTVNGTNNT